MLPPDCACYLINLDRSAERLQAMTARLSAAGIAFERVAGVDGMALSEARFQELTRRNRYYKPLRRGEVGCYLSHVATLTRFIASGLPYALLLEDDVVLPEDLSGLLASALALRARAHDPILAWDVLKLSNKRARHVDLAGVDAGHRLVEFGPSVPATTAAAVWTREGARRWVSSFHGVCRPVDCDLQHPWEHGLRIRSLHPSPVTAGTESEMGSTPHATRNPGPKLRYEAHRFVAKWRYLAAAYGWRFVVPWLWRRRLVYHRHAPG